MIWLILWTIGCMGWSLGLLAYHMRTDKISATTEAVATMTRVEMLASIENLNRTIELYEIVQRYVNMPPIRKGKPS